MTARTFTVPGTVVDVHDGDTVIVDLDLGAHGRPRHADLDLGWHIRVTKEGHVVLRQAVRVDGMNAPELGTKEGDAARLYALELAPPGAPVQVVSKRLYGSFEKYGRVLADLTRNGLGFCATMIATRHAKPWDGHGARPT